jgi:hypothetical protein
MVLTGKTTTDSKNDIKCVNRVCKGRSFCNITEDGNVVYVGDWLSPRQWFHREKANHRMPITTAVFQL